MEFQNLDLTVEDILNLHLLWITELYVQERKTEEEIVDLLCERRLIVTLPQIQRFIREWNLIQLPAAEESGLSPSPTLSDDWELVSSPQSPEPPPQASQASHKPSDPAEISEYEQKPLPSIPAAARAHYNSASKIQKKRPISTTDRLSLTCHHGLSSSDVHEVQTTLDLIPNGTSPMDRYAGEKQTHEQIALGLASYRRARDPTTNARLPRHEASIRVVRRGRRRKLERKDDGLEREERKKTPPSPCDEA